MERKLTLQQAEILEAEMRRLEADPAVDKHALRLFMQDQMPCGHAVGNLLTCPDPPFGCVVCGQPTEPQIILDADKCAHDHFQIYCQVDRIDDVDPKVFYANMRIVCTECQTPFHFIGLPYGSSPNEPRLEIGGLEARMPIGPGRLPVEPFGTASYELAKGAVRK